MSEHITPETLDLLRGWIGRSETLHDSINPPPIRGLSATLDRPDAEPLAGDPLPYLWHWLYFLPQPRLSEVGSDGHPKRGGFLPPVPLPRRMWAGSNIHWNAANPLLVGDTIQRTSHIASVNHKSGRSGDLIFVQVEHQVSNSKGAAVTEVQDIVYRAATKPGDPVPVPVAAETNAPWQLDWAPDPVMLFRYSALTFNGHRIHYDRTYATQEEGYPGLVVHGPLLATLLMDLLRRHAPQAKVTGFSFKALRPTIDSRPMRVNGQMSADGQSVRLWAQDHEGWLTMSAEATLA